jgi:hypothetical protein
MCVRVVGGGGTFEVKECTQERLGFGGVKRMKHVALKRPVDLCGRHAGPTVGSDDDESWTHAIKGGEFMLLINLSDVKICGYMVGSN